MALQLSEDRDVSGQAFERHLGPEELAAYVDNVTAGDARARIESHLATCDECRAELADVGRLVATVPRAHTLRRHIWIPAVAAAVLMMVVWPRTTREPPERQHREATVAATVSPRALSPLGAVDSVKALAWSSVPQAANYRVRLFDSEGSVLFERQTTDTTIAVPASINLRRGGSYHWIVDAETGFDRHASSELVEFSIRRARP